MTEVHGCPNDNDWPRKPHYTLCALAATAPLARSLLKTQNVFEFEPSILAYKSLWQEVDVRHTFDQLNLHMFGPNEKQSQQQFLSSATPIVAHHPFYPCIYSSMYLSIHLSICPSLYLLIDLSIHVSFSRFVDLFIYLSIYLSFYLFFLSVCLSVFLSSYLSTYLPI